MDPVRRLSASDSVSFSVSFSASCVAIPALRRGSAEPSVETTPTSTSPTVRTAGGTSAAEGRVSGIDTPEAEGIRPSGDPQIGFGVPRGGVHEPGVGQVCLLDVAGQPRDESPLEHRGEVGDQLGGGDDDYRPVFYEAAGASRRDSPAADDEYPAAEQFDADHRGHAATSASGRRATCTTPSTTFVGQAFKFCGSRPIASRHSPVRRSKTCLCMGDATVGRRPGYRRCRAT